MVNKFNLEEMQQAVDSRQLTALKQPQNQETIEERQKFEKVMDRLWLRLSEIYGSALVSQYGETIPEAWELLLKEVTPDQIASGLGKLATRESAFPPNAAEFRQLCLPATISPNGGNSDAYLMISDPKHPSYQDPKRIESDSYVSKRRQAGRSALDGMKDLLADVQDSVPLNGKMSDEEVKALIEQERKDAEK